MFIKQVFIRLILYLAVSPYVFAMSEIVMTTLLNLYGKHNFKYSYIQSINTPDYKNTDLILEDFNRLGDRKIVSFQKIQNGRPIVIEQMGEFEKIIAPDAVGIAYPTITKCLIRVKKGLDFFEYRDVLIHEYLHCYGFMHTPDKTDLMYYSVTPVDKSRSIKDYAEKMRKKFYE